MRKIILSIALCLAIGMMPLTTLAGAPTGHGCFSLDGDIWCDLCDLPMEHACFSEDGNIRCDLCDALIAHVCFDQNHNGSCDVCTRPCENQEGPLTGDISGEGAVNMADVAKLYAHIKNTKPLTDESVLDRCDITGEGKINLADVARLYAHIKGTNKLF